MDINYSDIEDSLISRMDGLAIPVRPFPEELSDGENSVSLLAQSYGASSVFVGVVNDTPTDDNITRRISVMLYLSCLRRRKASDGTNGAHEYIVLIKEAFKSQGYGGSVELFAVQSIVYRGL